MEARDLLSPDMHFWHEQTGRQHFLDLWTETGNPRYLTIASECIAYTESPPQINLDSIRVTFPELWHLWKISARHWYNADKWNDETLYPEIISLSGVCKHCGWEITRRSTSHLWEDDGRWGSPAHCTVNSEGKRHHHP